MSAKFQMELFFIQFTFVEKLYHLSTITFLPESTLSFL